MKTKLISLEEKHFEWIEENCLNFSRWVRKRIDEEMEKNG